MVGAITLLEVGGAIGRGQGLSLGRGFAPEAFTMLSLVF